MDAIRGYVELGIVATSVREINLHRTVDVNHQVHFFPQGQDPVGVSFDHIAVVILVDRKPSIFGGLIWKQLAFLAT